VHHRFSSLNGPPGGIPDAGTGDIIINDFAAKGCFMKRSLIAGLTATLCMWLLFASLRSAAAAGPEVTLRGLSGVMVKIDIDGPLVQDGMSISLVRADIESILEAAGIKVFREKDWLESERHPQLYVLVNGSKVQDNWKFYTFAVNVHLMQDVYIMRNNQTELHPATTWFKSLAGHGYFGDIRMQIKEMIDSFTTAFLAANKR
jgi:hypothetical protein